MNKLVKRLLTGTLAFATILTALPVTAVHASGNQYWTESAERVGYIEHVMNDGSIKSTFNEGHMKVEGETAYCVDINTNFKNGYKTRSDASTRMSSDQIADVALSLEYVKQYTASHTNLNYKQGYLLEQCVVWQRLSEQLGWQCDNVRASYNEISQAVQNEVYAGAKAFVKANKGRYECGGYIYTGEGQDIGQFWAKLNVGNAKVKKTSSNPTVTDGNANYSFEGATFGVYSDKGCNSQLATLTADGNGDTKEVEVKAGTVYIKELSAPKGYKLDSTVHALNVEAGKTATLTVADTPKVTETLIDLFKIDMETGKSTPQGTASLEGAEFTWSYYDGYYNADNLPAKATRTWTTKTVAEKDNDGTIHYVSRLADSYKVSGDSFYTQDSKNVLPLGTLTVTESKAPNGYLLDGAYMQADGSSEQIKGTYLTQISEDGELNRIRASDKSLVYHFCIGWLLLLFVAVFLLLNLRQFLVTDWKDFNLLHAGITWTAYNSITVLIATGVCAVVAFLYYRYGYDRIKRLFHRQKLARMVLENKWYEAENTKDSGFFTDLQSRSREKIVWFPPENR